MTVGIYYGGDSGFEEKDAVLSFAEGIDVHGFAVQKTEMVNSRSCPPIFLCIEKLVLGKRKARYVDAPASDVAGESDGPASISG